MRKKLRPRPSTYAYAESSIDEDEYDSSADIPDSSGKSVEPECYAELDLFLTNGMRISFQLLSILCVNVCH